MQKYRVCDITVESSIPLPELCPVDNADPAYFFRLLPARFQDSDPCPWFHQWCLPDGEPSLLIGRCGAGYLLRFSQLADFFLSNDGQETECLPCPSMPLMTIRHLFLDQIVPIILSLQGKLVLHASAVLTPDGAVAFIGATGWGKSTLASSFSETGSAVLTDDCLLLREEPGQVTAIPSYPGLRLWPETVNTIFGAHKSLAEVAHYSEKRRLNQSVGILFCSGPTPLRRIYFLAPLEVPGETVTINIDAVSPRYAFMELVKHRYLVDITDRFRLRQEFERLSRIAALPLFYRLTFPRDFSMLRNVQQAVLENLRLA